MDSSIQADHPPASSSKISCPKLSDTTGRSIHRSSVPGTLAGPTASGHRCSRAVRLNRLKSAFEMASAITAPGDEHRRIFWMYSWQPIPAATAAMAFTSVVHSAQELL